MGRPAWSGDGSWFVVEDDLDRLALVTTNGSHPPVTRILVDGGSGQAVIDAQLVAR